MIADRTKTGLPIVTGMVAIVMLAGATVAHAVPLNAPLKLLLSSHIGWKVNETTGGNTCVIASKNVCRNGVGNGEPQGFDFPSSVAVNNDPASPHHEHVYVADSANYRVQELTATGSFVSMFGWNVNKTKEKTLGATQAEKNVCTAVSGNVCQAGTLGTAAEQFDGPQGIAVDSSTGEVYVQENGFGNLRVDKYTADGQFVWMVGGEVNLTKDSIQSATEAEKNLCTAVSKDVCTAGAASTTDTGHGAFNSAALAGNLVAVGGSGLGHFLYVGDEHRVQEFRGDGTWAGEILLTVLSSQPESSVVALTADEAGDLYLVYRVNSVANVIREFNQEGLEVKNFLVSAREAGDTRVIIGLALDSSGRLAIVGTEEGVVSRTLFGLLYDAGTARLLTEFPVPTEDPGGIGFKSNDELYMAGIVGHEVLAYVPVAVGELVTGAVVCKGGAEQGKTLVTFDCAPNSEVNPEGVEKTEVWVQWGPTPSLGFETIPKQPVAPGETLMPVTVAPIKGLRPNETFYYRLAGEDENVRSPELLTGDLASSTTPIVPPEIVGKPSASFVRSSSAVMFGELNAENTKTTYTFEYGACENLKACANVGHTAVMASAEYGKIGVTLEATGLQPNTTYHYRLVGRNEHEEEGVCIEGECEGTFTTSPAPAVQATTGPASAIATTSAIVSGTVNPDGQPATYAFELGIYQGAGTQYGVVFSGSTDASVSPIPQTLALTGLQPGTTYAYRITISSGYGHATGETFTFSTKGSPSVLTPPAVPPQLTIPSIHFPVAQSPTKKCRPGYKRDKHGKCVKSQKNSKQRKKRTNRKKK